jgi:hypothetical protein
VTHDFPDEVWDYVFRPPPAWPWSIEPDFDPNGPGTPLLDRDFPTAAKSAFAFLKDLGFALTAADAWDVSPSAVMVVWERADAVVLATLADDGSFYALIGRGTDDAPDTPARDRLSAYIGHRDDVAGFGSLPVLGRTPDEVATAVADYAAVLRSRTETLLADRPIAFDKLHEEVEHAIEDIRRPRLVAHLTDRAETAWNDARYEAFLDAVRALGDLGSPIHHPERVTIAEARRRPPLTLGDSDLPETDRIRRAVELVEETQRRLNAAVEERHASREAWARWEDAAREWHEAMALLYSTEFWDSVERLQNGDRSAIDPAITFLEVDPWVFRSGYAKETILRFLKRADLNGEQAARLRQVVLAAVDAGDRREFRGYCRLACRVVDDDLRIALLERLRSSDRGRARRALWVLDALGESLGPDDRAVAQRLLELAATDPDWWRVSSWVRSFMGRYADQPWVDGLLEQAVGGGRETGAALRLLSGVRLQPTEEQRRTLGSLVLRQIERGDDEDWLESTAVLADGPAFREALVEVYRTATEPDERRRAWWAINAIRRTARDGWPPGDFAS